MTQIEVISRLQTIFDNLFMENVVLTPELSADDVEEWDSQTQINLEVAVENAFNISFRVGETQATKNVGEFADLIIRRMNGA